MNLLEILSYGFIQRALLAGTLIAVLCSVLGVFLVLRRMSLIGDGLAHVTFGSTAIALALKLYSAASLLVSLPLVLLASLGMLKLTEKTRLSGDAAIGIGLDEHVPRPAVGQQRRRRQQACPQGGPLRRGSCADNRSI